MKHKQRAQAAQMVIASGGKEGGPDNRHRGAEQWLFVVSGLGAPVVRGVRYPLRAGTLLLIEHNDRHEISNTGRQPLKTLNIYNQGRIPKAALHCPRPNGEQASPISYGWHQTVDRLALTNSH
jgi:mannose-6-phosphate isomerase-like protein (cupin superfamily)